MEDRYKYVLKELLAEDRLYFLDNENQFIINANKEAIENLDIFKGIKFEEINFYVFYVNYLSKKENENKKVIVGYNGEDGKEVTFKELKEDINKIRDERSTFKSISSSGY